ncbi:MAG: methionyl-tRNA formyltransferase [Gemmatimonadota bacterium]|nr:methionyl-tRNA formyltransferase [Gemmatimonadota bacterium]
MKVLFWGTPDFGLPSLDAMRAAGHEIVGAVTNPDRPAGRGRSLRRSAVKRWAEEAGVPVLQPERPRGDDFLDAARALGPDVSVVAAYGQILRQDVLDLPPLGSLNVHGSLLPALRGAAPVNWAIIRGHPAGGVSIMRMVLELDAGPVFAREPIPIGPATTAGELYEATARRGGELLVRVLRELEAGTARAEEQDHDRATYAPKLARDDARIDWGKPASDVDRWIRGCDPWPAAWTELEGSPVQLFAPGPEEEGAGDAAPGTIVEAHPVRGLAVAAGGGTLLRVGEVKPAGRRRMTSAAWIRGTEGLEGEGFA